MGALAALAALAGSTGPVTEAEQRWATLDSQASGATLTEENGAAGSGTGLRRLGGCGAFAQEKPFAQDTGNCG